MRSRLDNNGVRWAGSGAIRGRRVPWERYAKALGERYIPFAGQSELNIIYKNEGMAAMLDDKNAGIQQLYAAVEEDFKAGRIKGVGEIFINNERSHPREWFRRKGPTDAPSIRLFYGLAAKYGGFLTFHMHGDSDSMEQLDALLASDRNGRVILNHCGIEADASTLRTAFARNPNLFCEISFRYPPMIKSHWRAYSERKMFDEDGIDDDWLKLIEEFPDRFMIGTDAHGEDQYGEAIETVRKGLLPYLRPETARKFAFGNAKDLFDLK